MEFSSLLTFMQLDINLNVETKSKNDFKFQPNVQDQPGTLLTKKTFTPRVDQKTLPVKWEDLKRFLAV